MPHTQANKRLQRTTDLCDELASTMAQLQHRLEIRRTRMRQHMNHMARGLRIHSRL